MTWQPDPPKPPQVAIEAVAADVMRSKGTLHYHDATRIAEKALIAALPWANELVREEMADERKRGAA